MIVIDSSMSKTELISLYMHFGREKDKVVDELSSHTEKYEMQMTRVSMMETKYKSVWDKYRDLTNRFIECKDYQKKIIFFMTKINKENAREKRRKSTI